MELAALRRQIETGGMPASLAFLNARVPHRYTAVYRLRGPMLYCAHLHDKTEVVNTGFLQEVPLDDSFCQFAIKEGVFLVDDSTAEPRLEGHPYQGVVMAYHALPLLDGDGRLCGTLCHFDLVRRTLPAGELDFLRNAAPLIAGTVEDCDAQA